ncbi:histidine phosphatase superfamily [Syncephalis fuscata]|nr:histidine phosphatase superfamily [Syncephalis fuscata]
MLYLLQTYTYSIVMSISAVLLLAVFTPLLQPLLSLFKLEYVYISDNLQWGNHSIDYTLCQANFPTWSTYKPLNNAQLVHIQLVTRHGDRAPVVGILPYEQADWQCADAQEATHMLTPDNDEDASLMLASTTGYIRRIVIPESKAYPRAIWSSGTCTVGQLTRKGVEQHKALGQNLREIYIDGLGVLPDQLTASSASLYVRSSDTQRTLASAAALLAGLWPATKRNTSHSLFNNFNVYPTAIETMWGHVRECPRAAALLDHLQTTSTSYRALIDQYQPLRHRLEQILNTANQSPYDNDHRFLMQYMDPIYARYCHNKALPCHGVHGCVTDQDAEALLDGVSRTYAILRSGRLSTEAAEYNRLTLGYFLGELRDRIVKAVDTFNTSSDSSALFKPTFELFSGHDSTIYGIIGSLGELDLRWPPYASNLLFEVWQSNANLNDSNRSTASEYIVRIIYNGRVLTLPWCNTPNCPLSIYLDHLSSLIPANLMQECQIK